MTGRTDGAAGEAIAVVGMALRVPGARDADGFWRRLVAGDESITTLTDEELLAAGETPERLAHPGYVRAVSLLDEVECFDHAFFGYGAGEAARMDPQQRLFLEGARAAFEDAGHVDERSAGTTAVFCGSAQDRYVFTNLIDAAGRPPPLDDLSILLGNEKDYTAARVCHHLGLTGPALAVQTGCSSALVAVSLAADALLARQCDTALAGGVALRLPQRRGYVHVADGILSPDGHCRPFDARAGGTVFGSGLGVVVLRRLEDALRDGDTVHAVLTGIAVNNDGADRLGFTAPSIDRQAAVIALAQALAGVDPATVGFVEAHGTGTALGDPIEVAALAQAFGIGGARPGSVALGSIKGNLGHLDAAAGIVGFLKAVLAVERGVIPPTLHFETPNPALELERTPFFVNAEALPWDTGGAPRRAGVSSFGMGGTNVHAVLEQAPTRAPSGPSRSRQLLLLSGRTAEALERARADLAAALAAPSAPPLADVAHTLRTGRTPFGHRLALVCTDADDARRRLAAPGRADTPPSTSAGTPGDLRPPVTFLFPGQGSQHVDMARDLYEHEPVFREHVDRACDELRDLLDLDLREVLYPGPDPAAREAARQRLRGTDLAQPALFVVEYALARLWMEWDVRPDVMLGHSLGELVAACLDQVFRPEHALRLVALRGRLMAEQPTGAMLSVPLSEQELLPRLGGPLALAAANHPRISTVSGPADAVDALAEQLAREGLRCRRLEVSHAFHSSMMEPAMAAFAAEVARVPRKPPEHAFVSNVTGRLITPAEATDPQYWARQLRRTVRFADGVAVLGGGPRLFLEVGPGRALTTLVGELVDAGAGQHAVPCLRHPSEERSDTECLLEAAGQLWVRGVPFDGAGFSAGEDRRRVSLPTTPFARTRCWIEPGTLDGPGTAAEAAAAVATPGALAAPATTGAPPASPPAETGSRGGLTPSDDPADWFHVPTWQRRPLPARPRADATPGTARWLVFTDDAGAWDGLLTGLAEHGGVVEVRPAARFACLGPGRFALDPARPSDLATLRATLGDACPPTIVSLGLATADAEPVAAVHGPRGLAAAFDGSARRLVVVTRHAVDVGAEPPVATQAAAVGACRAVQLEHPTLRVGVVDVETPGGTAACSALLTELTADDARTDVPRGGDADTVAWRNGQRWVAGVLPLALPETDARAGGALREGGVYLVTGGLGGIGLTLAEHLVTRCGARVALCGRDGLPPEDGWDAPGLPERTRRRIAGVRRLRDAGGEALVLAADVTDPAAMEAAFAATRDRFGALHGVIHAAGLPGAGLGAWDDGAADAHDDALPAKLAGAHVLLELADQGLELLVLCSSVSTVFGGLGQVDYCAGNAALDALAVARRGRPGPRVVSIGWDTWAEVGMAADAVVPEALAARKRAVLAEGLTCAEGVEVFLRALAADEPHLLVSRTPLAARRAAIRAGAVRDPAAVEASPGDVSAVGRAAAPCGSPGTTTLGAVSVSESTPTPTAPVEPPEPAPGPGAAAGTPTAARVAPAPAPASASAPTPAAASAPRTADERIADDVSRIWCQLLGLDRAGPEDSFFEQGGNSLLATQMLARIREQYTDADLSLAGLFAEPTLGSLVRSVQRTHGGADGADDGPTLPARILGSRGDERRDLLETWLRAEVGVALDGDGSDPVPADGRLDRLDLTLLAAHLTWAVRRDLDLPLYPPEVRQRPSLSALARLVDGELERRERGGTVPGTVGVASGDVEGATGRERTDLPDAGGGGDARSDGAAPGAVPARGAAGRSMRANAGADTAADVGFVLSSPRSGSTLLRLMLSAHPRLFCPPELFLLDHAGMADWQADDFSDFYRDGLVRALMAAADLEYAAALERVEALVARDATVEEVYTLLRARPDRLLVDKTPTYALGMASLQRAEELFDAPRYVGLVRHPLAVIESFVVNRLDRLRRVRGDPHDLAERYWVQCNRNVVAFGEQVGEARFLRVTFEDLVRRPEEVARRVCAHLGTDWHADVLDPYGKGRMFGGPGDPNIHRHTAIDPGLADAWRGVTLPRPLGDEARRLAADLGYELPPGT